MTIYKCPFDTKRYKDKASLYDHMEKFHKIELNGMSAAQYAFNYRNHKNGGKCVECGAPTKWNPVSEKYERYCGKPSCKKQARLRFEKNMTRVYNKTTLLNDPDIQKKMLANRKISGTYEWENGYKHTYTGTYEKDFLKFVEFVLNWKNPNDIIMPATRVFKYKLNNVEKLYIPDVYISSLNLFIEIKGTNNFYQKRDFPMEKAKDDAMRKIKDIDYLKITDKNYHEFIDYLHKKINGSTIYTTKKSKTINETYNEYLNLGESFYDYIRPHRKNKYFDIKSYKKLVNKVFKGKIYVNMTDSKTYVAKTIKWYTGNDNDHSTIMFDKGFKTNITFDRNRMGRSGMVLENILLSYNSNATFNSYEINITDKQKDLLLKFIEDIATIGYDFSIRNTLKMALFGIGSEDDYKKNGYNLFCTQFVDMCLKTIGIDITEVNSSKVDPKILEDGLKKNKFKLAMSGNLYQHYFKRNSVKSRIVNFFNKNVKNYEFKIDIDASNIHNKIMYRFVKLDDGITENESNVVIENSELVFLDEKLKEEFINNIETKKIYLGTHNKYKIEDFENINLLKNIKTFDSVPDIKETESDILTTIKYKSIDMYNKLNKKIDKGSYLLIEDTSLEINGVDVGGNIRWMLDNIGNYKNRKAIWTVLIGLTDGKTVWIFRGDISGKMIKVPRGNGYGFDNNFIVDGEDMTLGELKDIGKPYKYSARKIALQNMINGKYVMKFDISQVPEWKGEYQHESVNEELSLMENIFGINEMNYSFDWKAYWKLVNKYFDGHLYVVLTKNQLIRSKFIRTFTRADVDHGSIMFDRNFRTLISFADKSWGVLKSDRVGLMIEDVPITYLNNAEVNVYPIKINSKDKQKILDLIKDIAIKGNKYDYYGAIRAGIASTAYKQSYENGYELYCSQFVDIVMKLVGKGVTNVDSSLVKPVVLKKALEDNAIKPIITGNLYDAYFKYNKIDKKIVNEIDPTAKRYFFRIDTNNSYLYNKVMYRFVKLESDDTMDDKGYEHLSENFNIAEYRLGQMKAYGYSDNAPTFAYRTLYGKRPKQQLSGMTNSPKKNWNGLLVDKCLKDKWLENINNLPVEIRSTDCGKSKDRPAFVIFRMKSNSEDNLAIKLSDKLNEFKHIHSLVEKGRKGRYRISVVGDTWEGQQDWESWWNSIHEYILKAYNEVEKYLSEELLDETIYSSNYNIGDEVVFIPMVRHLEKYKIGAEKRHGIITSITFTKAKVFYDILDDYYGKIFDNVDSGKVFSNIHEELKEDMLDNYLIEKYVINGYVILMLDSSNINNVDIPIKPGLNYRFVDIYNDPISDTDIQLYLYLNGELLDYLLKYENINKNKKMDTVEKRKKKWGEIKHKYDFMYLYFLYHNNTPIGYSLIYKIKPLYMSNHYGSVKKIANGKEIINQSMTFIKPNYHHKGYGLWFKRNTMSDLKNRVNYKFVVLTSQHIENTKTIELNKKIGFKEIKRKILNENIESRNIQEVLSGVSHNNKRNEFNTLITEAVFTPGMGEDNNLYWKKNDYVDDLYDGGVELYSYNSDDDNDLIPKNIVKQILDLPDFNDNLLSSYKAVVILKENSKTLLAVYILSGNDETYHFVSKKVSTHLKMMIYKSFVTTMRQVFNYQIKPKNNSNQNTNVILTEDKHNPYKNNYSNERLYYHASPVQGIKELKLNKSKTSHLKNFKPKIYASDDIGYAAGFSFNWGDADIKFYRKSGKTWIIEIPKEIKGVLDKKASMYFVEPKTFVKAKSTPTPEVISNRDVKIVKEIKYNTARDCLEQNGVEIVLK